MAKSSKKVQQAESPEDLLHKLSSKLANLENQIKERDSKLDVLEAKHKNADTGSQKFGVSDWKDWENGSEKGYYRSMYVDIRTIVTPRG